MVYYQMLEMGDVGQIIKWDIDVSAPNLMT